MEAMDLHFRAAMKNDRGGGGGVSGIERERVGGEREGKRRGREREGGGKRRGREREGGRERGRERERERERERRGERGGGGVPDYSSFQSITTTQLLPKLGTF